MVKWWWSRLAPARLRLRVGIDPGNFAKIAQIAFLQGTCKATVRQVGWGVSASHDLHASPGFCVELLAGVGSKQGHRLGDAPAGCCPNSKADANGKYLASA